MLDRRCFTRGLAAGVAALSVLVLAGGQAVAQPIRIGSFLSVTGPASFLGDPELKTLELYVDEINEAGGVLGRPLELVYYDVGVDADAARTAVIRLIEQDEVDAIVGGSTSGQTLAVIPLVEEAGLPFISLAGSVRIIDPVNRWVFKTPHTDTMACATIFTDLQDRGITRIGLISGTGGFGRSMQGQCQALATDFGITIIADETYGAGDSDMTAQLTRIRNTEGVEAVVNAGFGQGPAMVTRNFRQVGLDVPLYQSHGVASRQFIELAGSAAEGVRLPAAALLVANILDDSDPQREVLLDYIANYESTYDSAVSTFGGHAFDALFILVGAMERAGSTDREAVRAAIETTQNFVGTGGIVNMSAEDHLGLDLSAFKMLEIRNGDWTLAE